MRVIVNSDTCLNMGQCAYEAVDVVSLDDAGQMVYVADVDDSLREQVELASMLCPTQSISIGD